MHESMNLHAFTDVVSSDSILESDLSRIFQVVAGEILGQAVYPDRGYVTYSEVPTRF